MIRVWLSLMLIGAIAVASAPQRVHAQPAADKPAADNPVTAMSVADKRKVARQYVEAGQAAQESHDYDTAITFYQKAFDLLPHPTLIFDIAQCHRLAGRLDPALSLYRRYLTEVSTGPEAQTARKLIAEIEAAKAARPRKADEAGAEPARQAEAGPPAIAARKPDVSPMADDPHPAAAAPSPASPPQPEALASPSPVDAGAAYPGRTTRIAGVAISAAGLLALAIGTGYGVRALSISDQLSQPHAPFHQSDYDRGQRDGQIATAALIGGGALIVVGGALTWFGFRHPPSTDRIAIAPLAAPGFAGIVVAESLP